MLVVVLSTLVLSDRFVPQQISWTYFVNDLLPSGRVIEIIVQHDADIAFVRVAQEGAAEKNVVTYCMNISETDRFEKRIRSLEAAVGIPPELWVPIRYDRINWHGYAVSLLLILFAIYILMILNRFRFKVNISDMMAKFTNKQLEILDPTNKKNLKIKFKDVAGLHEAKVEISEFVDYLKNPTKYSNLGAKLPKGALLTGPPGCGKTLLAKALAVESSAPFIAVNGTEFVEIIGGLGASRIRNLFKEAKARAPCIIYIDEIDAIGRKRSGNQGRLDGGSSEEEQTLNQLLVEMDGMDSTKSVIVLASTNRADILDKALLRPGRFDRHILIDHPTASERQEIFNLYLKKIRLDNDPIYYSKRLAQMTPGMTGADISNVVNEAAIRAATTSKKIVTVEELDYALQRILGGSEKRNSALLKEEREVVAYHEAGHAIVGWLLEYTDALLKISIVPRTNALLGFAQYSPSDRKILSKDELFDRMCMLLGGRAAENVIFGKITTGAEDDLKKVTKSAYAQIMLYGMNEKVGPLSFASTDANILNFYEKPFSSRLQKLMDEEASQLVSRAYFFTEQLLKNNKEMLEKLAKKLLEKEVLNYEEIKELIGPPKYGEKFCIDLVEHVLPQTD
ncbi:unnamed protein product [Dracunculus medinensis]|uniref:AAA domain-containing protein n=1 Tax=Dracunculus medinensis TaxID=318479 RepID=A0A0N4UJ61_DRAME|nr:unnamed protein product [Dracunculus medinensis]